MLHFYCFLLLILTTAACSSPAPQNKPVEKILSTNTIDSNTVDTLIESPQSSVAPVLPCGCKKRTYKRTYRPQVTFRAYQQKENLQKIAAWTNNPNIHNIHILLLMNYDTIPEELAMFEKVTKVILEDGTGTKGLDLFPKLEEVHFISQGKPLNIQGKWPQRIKLLAAQKTVLEGIKSFNSFPNLEVIDLAYAGFKTFPTDLEQLPCLQELHLRAYINGSKDQPLNLSQFDLSQHPCLRQVSFFSWQNAMTGFPQEALAPHLERVEVHHKNLTKEEQLQMKDVKNILFDRAAY